MKNYEELKNYSVKIRILFYEMSSFRDKRLCTYCTRILFRE